MKKDENGAGEEEEEDVEDEDEEVEGEEEYDLPYGDEEDIEAEGMFHVILHFNLCQSFNFVHLNVFCINNIFL